MSLSTGVLYITADEQSADRVVDAVTAASSSLSIDVVTSLQAASERVEDGDIACLIVEDDGAEAVDFDGLQAFSDASLVLYTSNDSPAVVDAAQAAGAEVVFRSDEGGPARLAARLTTIVPADAPATDVATAPPMANGSVSSIHEAMLETVSAGVYALDNDGYFVAVNEAYAQLTGFARSELLGQHATTVTGDTIHAEANEAQLALERGERVPPFTTTLTRPDGTATPIEAHLSLLSLGTDGYGRIGVVQDVSQRERLQTELDEMFNRVTDAFFGLDTDWTFTFVNERAETLLGEDDAALLGTSIWEQYPDTLGTAFESEYRRAVDIQEPVSFEAYFAPEDAWHRVRAYPSETGLSVYFRDITDKRVREERIAALNRAMQALLETTTRTEVVELGVETARDALDLSTLVVLQYDEASGRLRPAAQTIDEATDIDDELLVGDDAIAWQVFVENEPRVYDSLSAELDIETAVESAVVVPMGRHGVLLAADAAPDAFSENDLSLIDILGASVHSALDRADREETLRERSETLATQNEALDRLRRINGVIREITGTLTQASTREEIESAVCDRLAAVDPYRLAWIGSKDPVTDELTPRVSAGIDTEFLSVVTAPSSGADETHPSHLALETLEPQVQNIVHGDPPFEPWREAALKRGFRSSIAVPIVHRETLYSVLCLYASEPNVFNEMEQTVLGELGEIIGHALNALERTRALVSERSVELEFALDDPLDQPLQFVAALGAAFDYQSIVQRSDGHLHLFFVVRAAAAEDVLDAGSSALGIDDIILVADRNDELLFECTLSDESVFANLLDRGAVPRVVSMDGTTGTMLLRIPQNAEPRSVVELLERAFERAELTARREYDDPVWTRQEFHSAFEDELTDRQEEVLRTAYFAGFFEWPRDSTGEEVADILGVSQPTVHRHVRAGERKLFSLLFDR